VCTSSRVRFVNLPRFGVVACKARVRLSSHISSVPHISNHLLIDYSSEAIDYVADRATTPQGLGEV
ncbi:hypothetical protein J6590_103547, partial [Homalodisca vitripennis]